MVAKFNYLYNRKHVCCILLYYRLASSADDNLVIIWNVEVLVLTIYIYTIFGTLSCPIKPILYIQLIGV